MTALMAKFGGDGLLAYRLHPEQVIRCHADPRQACLDRCFGRLQHSGKPSNHYSVKSFLRCRKIRNVVDLRCQGRLVRDFGF